MIGLVDNLVDSMVSKIDSHENEKEEDNFNLAKFKIELIQDKKDNLVIENIEHIIIFFISDKYSAHFYLNHFI